MDTHALIRLSMLNEQWCTAGTKAELAEYIRDGLVANLGHYMNRYTVADIEERLSDAVQCESDASRHHYLFDAGRLSYAP